MIQVFVYCDLKRSVNRIYSTDSPKQYVSWVRDDADVKRFLRAASLIAAPQSQRTTVKTNFGAYSTCLIEMLRQVVFYNQFTLKKRFSKHCY